MAIAALAKFTVKAGQGQAFEAVFRPLAEAVRKEPGARFCQLMRYRDPADTYLVIEIYEDEAALATHASYPHTKEGAPKVLALLANDPSVVFCDLV